MDQPREIAERLDAEYGRRNWDQYRNGWPGLLLFILERSMARGKFSSNWAAISDSWLTTSSDVASAKRGEIEELLKPLGASASTIALLHKVAIWFHETQPDERDLSRVVLDELPESEPQLVAVGPAWTLRILSGVFGLRLVALTSGGWRVGARHRWFDWDEVPEQAMETCMVLADQFSVDPAQVTEWLTELGADYCGSTPKCSGCPLEPFLGPSGPCEPE